MIKPTSDRPSASGDRSVAATNVDGITSTGDGAIIVAQQTFGVSYRDARSIAIDVFNENFERLKGDALRLAQERAEKITDDFLRRLQDTYPEAVNNFNQPGMQRALYRAQEAAACSEDGDLDDVLVDVLVERAKEGGASLQRVVLDEALQTIPKLTAVQINALSLIFYVRYTRSVAPPYETALRVLSFEMMRHVEALQPIASSDVALRHLAYAGCLSISMGAANIGKILSGLYFGVFSRGINPHSVTTDMRPAFREFPGNPGLLYCPVSDDDSLESYLDNLQMADEVESIKNILKASTLNESEVVDKIVGQEPRLRTVLSVWNGSPLKNAELTSVGTAIGYTNLRLKSTFNAPLSLWLSE